MKCHTSGVIHINVLSYFLQNQLEHICQNAGQGTHRSCIYLSVSSTLVQILKASRGKLKIMQGETITLCSAHNLFRNQVGSLCNRKIMLEQNLAAKVLAKSAGMLTS